MLDVEEIDDLKRSAGHGHVSTKHLLADVWVVRSNQVHNFVSSNTSAP